ncbi:endolytic transglycosylase MltG [Streptomyces sp. NBC_01465]|uniref:endolytic transglycosylase MltG n=1 Tax=Streptomyces sp. NBC_01465 TaxID=2903878 RepID=UPI002E37A1E3|nr:endolytic transglycosylase MltG [Streptomyces sp. NBC_01465]
MTEYGRGAGSEPWHPEDPLYGEQGWNGQQAASGHQDPYGGGQQQYPQQQPQYGNPQHQQQQYGNQQYGQDPYQQDPYAQQPQQHPQQPQYNGGWDTGQQAAMPYGNDAADPYGNQQPQYGGENPDYYRTPDAYPPPQPPGRREQEWQPEPPPAEETHPFFTGADSDARDDRDDYDDDPDDGGRGGRGDRRSKSKPKKRRSGCACLVVTAVLVGGVGGVGYFGYNYWQNHFSAAPDYTGVGANPVQVDIPKGTTIGGIGRILKEKGVVKSVDAFVTAADKDPKGKFLQAGVYSLNQEMSAANAVKAMVDPNSLNYVMVYPGERSKKIYGEIDSHLGLKAGTTAGVAKAQAKNLGLPDWADDNKDIKDPLEGFLYPASYSVAKGMKPEAVLKNMVSQANEAYGNVDLKAAARKLGLKSPLQVITVASLVQAEGVSKDDFKKMAAVVYNRLDPANAAKVQRKLQFDSAFNYLQNESNIDISSKEINSNQDPYNTYVHAGLPPGPIGNPGKDALAATLTPDTGSWLYFISIDGKTTQFSKTYSEFLKDKAKFDAIRKNGG